MKVTSASELGEAVRQARKAQGLRQADLALVAGTGRRFIGDLEKGKPTAQLGQVLRVIEALGLTVDLQPESKDAEAWTRLNQVGVRELRQNLSRYLTQVKEGESFLVTERGREVARLSPSGPADSPLARLVTERGATMPRTDLLSLAGSSTTPPAEGPPSGEVLDEIREERL